MKKIMYLMLSLVTITGIITLEGENILKYMQLSAGALVTLGVLFTSLFSFSYKEINEAFKDAFTEKTDETNINRYKRGAAVSSAMSRLCICWGIIGILLGIIFVLSHPNTPERLGAGLAMALISILYGIIYASILFIPMHNALLKKFEDSKGKH